MNGLSQLLRITGHRPYPLPSGPWTFYQEWNQSLFLHYKVPAAVIQPLIPGEVNLDTFEGQAWVSLVAFTMQNIRPAWLPPVSVVSDFHEINLRTYVVRDDRPGVYFLSMEASKKLSVWISKALSGLPYENAAMHRNRQNDVHRYASKHARKDFFLDTAYTIDTIAYQKTALDIWLTERYGLYLDKGSALYRFDVHHKEWPVNKVNIQQLKLQYKVGELVITGSDPYLAHYSAGVQVFSWPRQRII
jgi:uncharacterized protein YqjF (DUF2071 family)